MPATGGALPTIAATDLFEEKPSHGSYLSFTSTSGAAPRCAMGGSLMGCLPSASRLVRGEYTFKLRSLDFRGHLTSLGCLGVTDLKHVFFFGENPGGQPPPGSWSGPRSVSPLRSKPRGVPGRTEKPAPRKALSPLTKFVLRSCGLAEQAYQPKDGELKSHELFHRKLLRFSWNHPSWPCLTAKTCTSSAW